MYSDLVLMLFLLTFKHSVYIKEKFKIIPSGYGMWIERLMYVQFTSCVFTSCVNFKTSINFFIVNLLDYLLGIYQWNLWFGYHPKIREFISCEKRNLRLDLMKNYAFIIFVIVAISIRIMYYSYFEVLLQLFLFQLFTCSKSAIRTLEKGVKCVQS